LQLTLAIRLWITTRVIARVSVTIWVEDRVLGYNIGRARVMGYN